ncbi:MAG TPA: Rho termination factor N-terminal domain-containing protein, partial [Saprospiraceae bacterium]|nr:Rho termination factor N-terminal domain-containing protein [Saprospiraceae bacterium]
MYDIIQLNDKLVAELKEIAHGLSIKGYNKLTKQDLIYKILDEQALAQRNKNTAEVPVVDEPNPLTGRRPRKVMRMGNAEEPKPTPPAQEPPAEKTSQQRGRTRGNDSWRDRRDSLTQQNRQQQRTQHPDKEGQREEPAPAAETPRVS